MKTILVMLALYVGIYAWLSAGGSWQVAAPQAGEILPEHRVWQPRKCDLDLRPRGEGGGWRAEGNTLGWIFLPAIAVDRRFVHDARPAI